MNAVFTHNINKQNQDAAYDVHVHLYDTVNAYVGASAMVALNDNFWLLAELIELNLLANQHAHGWQHIFVNSIFETGARTTKGHAAGKLLSEASIKGVFGLVLGDMGRRTGVPAKKQLHFLRGASSKRKSTEPSDDGEGYALRTHCIL